MPELIKHDVTTGVFLIEAPSADVRILCGCPADAVKHLIKRGLISRIESGGVWYETGPNVILLSDVAVQNGCFSNLSEFPVLQMLYRQGMILPNHPGNTGTKPLLIGDATQLSAQLQYLYRGNYGLVSKKEMIAAGATPERADELMAIKLFFAFGAIRSSDALVDTMDVKSETLEIRNGVSVRRIERNRFLFRYEGEEQEVDLSLPVGKTYPLPAPISATQIPRSYFSVIHSGEADGWDANRQSMSSVLHFQGQVYLIDAGPNLNHSLDALGIGVNEIAGVFQTHAHDDHFAGITTLLQSGRRLKFFATPLVRATVEKKLSALLSVDTHHLHRLFDIHDLVEDEWNDYQGLEVMPIMSPHPLETTIFVFRAMGPRSYHTYGHFADIASFKVLDQMSSGVGNGKVSRELIEKVKEQYLQRLDLKKVDIGGGMIHGLAEDFREDSSRKIILAHTSEELTDAQKRVGSSAAFGVVDVFVPASVSYASREAHKMLRAWFPDTPEYDLEMFRNCEISSANPGTIIARAGDMINEALLLVRGSVERILDDDGASSRLSAGALLGFFDLLHGGRWSTTFRTVGYVKVLHISMEMFTRFMMRQKGLEQRLSRSSELLPHLYRADLFKNGLNSLILREVIDASTNVTLNARADLNLSTADDVYLILSGSVYRMQHDTAKQHLMAGDAFGGEDSLFDVTVSEQFRYRAMDDTTLLRIPARALADIPVVYWKLLTAFQALHCA